MITPRLRHSGLLGSVPRAVFGVCVVVTCCCAPLAVLHAAENPPAEFASNSAAPPSSSRSALTLGVGDAVTVQVYGKPELTTTTYVSEDGTIPVPLAGNVAVAGMSPAKAAEKVAAAFRQGKFLVDPQVTLLLATFRNQQVSVLGAVRTPGRFPVESTSTVLDVLAQAGGTLDGADVVVLLRPDKDGGITRTSIDLAGLSHPDVAVPTLALRGGDSLFIPPPDQFYIYGEVKAPNMYRLEPGMTVVQAISRGGGIGPRGSSSGIEIRRQKANGTFVTRSGKLNEAVQANDVIRVRESFF